MNQGSYDKKKEHNAESGWLGITDKFWITALVPEKNQSFRGEFVYKSESYKANYILNEPVVVQPSSSKTSGTKHWFKMNLKKYWN